MRVITRMLRHLKKYVMVASRVCQRYVLLSFNSDVMFWGHLVSTVPTFTRYLFQIVCEKEHVTVFEKS